MLIVMSRSCESSDQNSSRLHVATAYSWYLDLRGASTRAGVGRQLEAKMFSQDRVVVVLEEGVRLRWSSGLREELGPHVSNGEESSAVRPHCDFRLTFLLRHINYNRDQDHTRLEGRSVRQTLHKSLMFKTCYICYHLCNFIHTACSISTKSISFERHTFFKQNGYRTLRNRWEMTWVSYILRFFWSNRQFSTGICLFTWQLLHPISQNLYHSIRLIFTLRVVIKLWPTGMNSACYIQNTTRIVKTNQNLTCAGKKSIRALSSASCCKLLHKLPSLAYVSKQLHIQGPLWLQGGKERCELVKKILAASCRVDVCQMAFARTCSSPFKLRMSIGGHLSRPHELYFAFRSAFEILFQLIRKSTSFRSLILQRKPSSAFFKR